MLLDGVWALRVRLPARAASSCTQQPGQEIGAQIDDGLVTLVAQTADHAEHPEFAVALHPMDEIAEERRAAEQFTGAGVGNDVDARLRPCLVQRDEGRRRHPEIADVRQCDEEEARHVDLRGTGIAAALDGRADRRERYARHFRPAIVARAQRDAWTVGRTEFLRIGVAEQ